MTTVLTRAVAPILKIRAALRERLSSPAAQAGNVVSITDTLMLGWAESEVELRKGARTALSAAEDELADLRKLCARLASSGAEVSPLERLLVFTKIESAGGLMRQAFNAMAPCSLVLVVASAVKPDDCGDRARAPRGVSIARHAAKTVRQAREEGLAA